MAIKIRLRQQGRTNRPFYRVVVADVRSPRDGKYIEMVGWYNPFEKELDKSLSLKTDRIQHWLGVGAEITEKLATLIVKVAPGLVQVQVQRDVTQRANKLAKRKAKKEKKSS